MPRYAYKPFPYATPPELHGVQGERYQVVIVGAGPVGLAAAIDCALRGVKCVVLDDNDVVSLGSRAICWSKRTLEIMDRLGVGDRMVEKGVTWKVGRLFHRDREVWNFDLQPEPGHKMPAFVNLQQYYVEQYLVERAGDFPDLIDLRWKNRVAAVEQDDGGVARCGETPDGGYSHRGRVADRLRRCQVIGSRHARARFRRQGVRGTIPDRRCRDAGGFPVRALVLVRADVPQRPIGAAAQAARQHLPYRSAAWLGCRSGRGEEAGKRHSAHRTGDRPWRLHARLGVRLQLPVPAAAKNSCTTG